MKKPLLNHWERQNISHDTFHGAVLRLYLARLHFKRDLYQKWGCVVGWVIYRDYMKSIKIKTKFKEDGR